MKIYYVCECCDQVYRQQRSGQQEGVMGLSGICPDCAAEIDARGEVSRQSMPPTIYQ